MPRAIAEPCGNPGNEWSSVFQAQDLSGAAFILAGRNTNGTFIK
jgi:hypothetical protein